MIISGGNVVFGSSDGSEVWINGKLVSGGGVAADSKSYDEKKTVDCSQINAIEITNHIAETNVTVSNSSEAEVHFYGTAELDGDVKFETRVENHTLIISLTYDGNYTNGNLKLDLTIPANKTFNAFSVDNKSEGIDVTGISAQHITTFSGHGKVIVNAIASTIEARSDMGKVRVTTIAKANNITAYSGHGKVIVNANANADAIDASSNMGEVSVTTIAKANNITAHSGHGNVIVNANADVIDARSDIGEVRVTTIAKANNITAHSSHGAITVNAIADTIDVHSGMSSVTVRATVAKLITAKAKTGTIKLFINAAEDITVNVENGMGNISVKFDNVKEVTGRTCSNLGSVMNTHAGETGHTAKVNLDTQMGNIKIE